MKSPYIERSLPRAILFVLFILLLMGCGVRADAQALQRESSSVVPIANLQPFVGPWVSHAAGLSVAPDGRSDYNERVYQWCGPGVTPPCDSFKGDTIIPGIKEQIQLSRASNATAYGSIISSTIAAHRGANITLVRKPNDTVTLSAQFLTQPRVLCGPKAPADYCGA